MRKNLLLTVIVVAILIVSSKVICKLFVENEREISDFSIDNFNYYIKKFPSDKVLGEVNSYEDAESKAEEVWIEIYGESVKTNRPYIISFDNINQIWLVSGSLSDNQFGGVPHILIQKSDGKVLAVWHDK